MATRPTAARAHVLAAILWLTAEGAHALPSIDIVWQSTQTSQIGTPTILVSNTFVADIVLRAEPGEAAVIGVFVSISFDSSELQATGGRELLTVNLPGMGNVFTPFSPGFTIDNAAGLVTGFDSAILSPSMLGLESGSRTLGSIVFQLVSPSGSGDVDVIANVNSAAGDGIFTFAGESAAIFNGAFVDSFFFPDTDGDGRPNGIDNCEGIGNPGQEDADGDFRGDVCDNCPTIFNIDQQDTSGNGTGDVCNDEDLDGLLDTAETLTGVFVDESDAGTDPLNPDTDGDGLSDGLEVLDYGSNPHAADTDADTVGDAVDNCVLVANTDQANADAGTDDDPANAATLDAFGDRCDADLDNDGTVSSGDFFGYFRPCFGLFVSSDPQCARADLDGSGRVDSSDFFGYFRPQFGGVPGPGRRQLDPGRFTFSTCGQGGRFGPAQAQCDQAYAGTTLEGAVGVSAGIQVWTVPTSGTYRIEASGAQGGSGLVGGGLAARMSGESSLAAGDVLHILVGQSGVLGVPLFPGGGGGGSFVVAEPGTIPLVIAAGGGGGSNPPASIGSPTLVAGGVGRLETSGGDGSTNAPCGTSGGPNTGGGESGNGGGAGCGGGGGGLLTDGAEGTVQLGSFGRAYANGGQGGVFLGVDDDFYPHGGFGGGGAGGGSGGGGGGYSGGASSGGTFPPGDYGNGGGGGSFNAGTAQDNAAGVHSGLGQVTITLLTAGGAAVSAAAEQPVAAAQGDGGASAEPTGAAQGAGGAAGDEVAAASPFETAGCTGDGCQHTLEAAVAVPSASPFGRALLVLALVALGVALRDPRHARR